MDKIAPFEYPLLPKTKGSLMEKQRKWQLTLILTVIALTVYNILPTLFYYLQPLKKEITTQEGMRIGATIEKRIQALEGESLDWVQSFCDLLGVKPASISLDPEDPEWISVYFSKLEDASLFRHVFPRAGSLIPFAPAQLLLPKQEENQKQVRIQRKIPIPFSGEDHPFFFVEKKSLEYKKIAADRAAQIALILGGETDQALALKAVQKGNQAPLDGLSAYIFSVADLLEENKALGSRYAAQLTQGDFPNRSESIKTLIRSFEQARDTLKQAKLAEISKEEQTALEEKEARFRKAESLLKKWESLFASGQDPWENRQQIENRFSVQPALLIAEKDPLFTEITIDLSKDKILLKVHPDVKNQRTNPLFINQLAKISRLANESLVWNGQEYEIRLTEQEDTSGFLAFDLEKIAKIQIQKLSSSLKAAWHPKHPDLQDLAIVDYETYQALPPEKKSFCFVICSPLVHGIPHFNPLSLSLITTGMEQLHRNYEEFPHSELAETFRSDLKNLGEWLQQNGFSAYPFQSLPASFPIDGDFFFEKPDIISSILAATREHFTLHGSKRFAMLECSTLEQRILTENKIQTKIHEDLIRWRDEYRAAQVNPHAHVKFDVPKPTRSVFWSNLALSFGKLFRGDERKIIRWGLDLSGGKTVQIELRDANHLPVTSDADIKQGINELYNRVNKIGLSEVSIRQVGNHIVLDFPGSQALSASELIRASTMYFHVINEKFSTQNPILGETVHRFLQEIWNQAIVLNKKDPESLNKIAWDHLYGGSEETPQPKSSAAKALLEQGLRIASPDQATKSNRLDETFSKIACFRGADLSDWQGQTHPLLIVFQNYALEGAQLENIQASYDPSKGNFLSFNVKGPSWNREGQKINPQADLYTWTSRFSKEKISGTPLESHAKGRGWRMAVLLNDSCVSAPTLESALKESAMISGSFSLREVQKLAADLKAGSLTFTPQILSEKNVSPELGQTDRAKGIGSTVAALILVIIGMVTYYRFAGMIASIAVLFNLLILWATLQNLGATLTLSGIAGIILTVGMAVDANVLVFERIKEEFASSGRIKTAIQAGYRKAYSAIIDSNVTTIIAALILLNFDAGPIKSFAINLIIGIVSSMFTALFMTRFYFTGWMQNPKNQVLKMAHWIQGTSIDFLKKANIAFGCAAFIIIAGGYFLFSKGSTIFGMDFTGGFSLNVELESDPSKNSRETLEQMLHQKGLSSNHFQIRELSSSSHLRILFSTNMEEKGNPFWNLPLETNPEVTQYVYEKNPRIVWTVQAIQDAGLALNPKTLPTLDTEWTSMSGQMSASMRNSALLGLFLAFVSIFIYLSFRFEYKFAAAALICLFHDVLITIGLMGLLHAFGLPLQIDLNTVAALMTIVGYSLNDTIIIFDRIREEMRLHPTRPLRELVNSALNATLSRTTITSGITLLVLSVLVLLGGASIFSFALVMTIGVFFGTLSSWFIAAPLMLFFHKQEDIQESQILKQES